MIHRAPVILALTVDRHEDFVQEPRVSESTLSSLQLPSVVGAELPAPLANGFVGHDDSSFGQQILNIPEAHAVSVVEPDGMADDVGRKAMPMVAGPASVHPGIVPGGELTLMRQNSGRSSQDIRDAHEPLTCRGVIREPQPRGATGADEQRGAVEEFEPQRLHTLQQRHDRVLPRPMPLMGACLELEVGQQVVRERHELLPGAVGRIGLGRDAVKR